MNNENRIVDFVVYCDDILICYTNIKAGNIYRMLNEQGLVELVKVTMHDYNGFAYEKIKNKKS